jgi:hypothetical protein
MAPVVMTHEEDSSIATSLVPFTLVPGGPGTAGAGGRVTAGTLTVDTPQRETLVPLPTFAPTRRSAERTVEEPERKAEAARRELWRERRGETSSPAVDPASGHETPLRVEDGRRTTAVGDAAAALKALLSAVSLPETQWVETARLLRLAARMQRRSFPRIASVALLVSDALLYTPASALSADAMRPLQSAVSLLTEPFVGNDAERELFEAFVQSGWRVTPAFDAERLSEVAAAI